MRNATAKPIAPIANFNEEVDEMPPKGGPVGGPMDAKRSASVPARRNKKPKKNNDAIEGHVADVMHQIAANAKMSPGQLALGPPMPLARARGKGKAKADSRNDGLETIMECNDWATTPT